MVITSQKKRHTKRLLLVAAIVVVLLPIAYLIYGYVSFNVWLSEDSGALESYPTVLVKKGEVLREDDPWDKNAQMIDMAITQRNSMGRLVVLLSRSEIRYNLFRTRAYVKIFLETSLPNDVQRTAKVKALNVLAREKGKWHVRAIQDIAIE
jgi:hypothetical protein